MSDSNELAPPPAGRSSLLEARSLVRSVGVFIDVNKEVFGECKFVGEPVSSGVTFFVIIG